MGEREGYNFPRDLAQGLRYVKDLETGGRIESHPIRDSYAR